MKWNELFDADRIPSYEDIRTYIGEAKPIWDELVLFIEEKYNVKPQLDYSKCSAQPGWNIKYKKSGKSLCTLYPMQDHFIALVVVGTKQEDEVEIAVEAGIFTSYVKDLYRKTAFSAMGRWLMIEVKHKELLNDIKVLLEIRVRSK